MTTLRTWEDELKARGKDVSPGPVYGCPTCEREDYAFAIVMVGGEWHCSTCRRPEPAEDVPALTWSDIRGQRAVFLQSTDWSQLADVPVATREAFAPLRQRARDLPEEGTPDAAQAILQGLREAAAAL